MFGDDRIAQLQLPDPADADPHPRLLLDGRGIHSGESFTACFRMAGRTLRWR